MMMYKIFFIIVIVAFYNKYGNPWIAAGIWTGYIGFLGLISGQFSPLYLIAMAISGVAAITAFQLMDYFDEGAYSYLAYAGGITILVLFG